MNLECQKDIISELCVILRRNGENAWAEEFSKLLEGIQADQSDRISKKRIKRFSKIVSNGYATAGDLIFTSSNGKFLKDNDKYYELLSKLGR